MTANKVLAERARELAGRAPDGSPDRKAFGCAAAVLSTTTTVTGARRALAEWDGPDAVKAAALEALDTLATTEGTEP
jgi:hypothetical protein